MKSSIKHIFLAAGTLAMAASCSENSWNDGLDGFKVPDIYDKVESVDLTLTPDDYKTIAGLAANQSLAAEKGEEDALAAIGNNACFANDDEAKLYIPAFIASTDKGLPYYTWNDGSSVKVGYEVTSGLPENVKGINAGTLSYTLSEADYQQVWGSESSFIEALTPSKNPAANIPGFLKANLNAEEGQYAVASYNYTTTEPDFEAPTPKWEMTDVAGKAAVGEEVTIRGLVTAINSRGFVLTDKSGSILCYQASGFDVATVEIGNQITVTATVAAYNKGIQIAISDGSYTVGEKDSYTYPAPKNVTGPDMDAAIQATEDFHPEYVSFTGKLSISGNYYNVAVDGAETAMGSLYMTPQFVRDQVVDGETYTFTGYFMSISSGKYYNIVVTSVAAPGKRIRRANASATPELALYRYSGGKWTAATGMILLQPDVYKAMGLSYSNFSGSQPASYLPEYLRQSFPYAQEGTSKTIVYLYHTSNGDFYQAAEYALTNGEWTKVVGKGTLQFVKMNSEWKYNPSVEVTLPYARNTEPAYGYYMACVNWVLDNIVKPTDPSATLTTGTPLIDYRGNAEFYSGASAYYGNVDVRAATALAHCPEGYYDGMTDDEITLLVKKRFCGETMPGALSALHPDMKPEPGMEVTFTLHFTSYSPAVVEETLVYTVTGPGEFTYKSCTWFAEGEDADLKK